MCVLVRVYHAGLHRGRRLLIGRGLWLGRGLRRSLCLLIGRRGTLARELRLLLNGGHLLGHHGHGRGRRGDGGQAGAGGGQFDVEGALDLTRGRRYRSSHKSIYKSNNF